MLKIKKLHCGIVEPTRAYPTDSGLDVYAYLPDGDVTIAPGKLNIKYQFGKIFRRILDGFSPLYSDSLVYNPSHIVKIPLGFAIQLPQKELIITEQDGTKYKVVYEAQLRGRSGLANAGIFCHFGTIDNSYTGEMQVILVNHSSKPFVVKHGAKIAQLVIQTVCIPEVGYVAEFEETSRGANGFGSTGV